MSRRQSWKSLQRMCLFLFNKNKSIIPDHENEHTGGFYLLPLNFHSGCPFTIQTVLFLVCAAKMSQRYKCIINCWWNFLKLAIIIWSWLLIQVIYRYLIQQGCFITLAMKSGVIISQLNFPFCISSSFGGCYYFCPQEV